MMAICNACIDELMEALDSFMCQNLSVRSDKPFLMSIEDVFSIKGRGTVVTGRIDRGVIKLSLIDEVEIVGLSPKPPRKTTSDWRRDVQQDS